MLTKLLVQLGCLLLVDVLSVNLLYVIVCVVAVVVVVRLSWRYVMKKLGDRGVFAKHVFIFLGQEDFIIESSGVTFHLDCRL